MTSPRGQAPSKQQAADRGPFRERAWELGLRRTGSPPSPWELTPTAARVTQRPCGASHLQTLRWPRAAVLARRSVRTRGLGRDAESV